MPKHNIDIISNPALTDWKNYKKIQLESLLNDPLAFSKQYRDEIKVSDANWEKRMKQIIDGENLAVFARINKVFIGKIRALRTKNDTLCNSATIYGVYVSPKFRGTSVAHLLLLNIIKVIKQKYNIDKRNIFQKLLLIKKPCYVKNAHIFVTDSQLRAINFYKKEGFVITNRDNLVINKTTSRSGYAMIKNII
jgi:ribosomal protein S18 acetylase RimI-like enzyme